jgi:hypothetical protein
VEPSPKTLVLSIRKLCPCRELANAKNLKIQLQKDRIVSSYELSRLALWKTTKYHGLPIDIRCPVDSFTKWVGRQGPW